MVSGAGLGRGLGAGAGAGADYGPNRCPGPDPDRGAGGGAEVLLEVTAAKEWLPPTPHVPSLWTVVQYDGTRWMAVAAALHFLKNRVVPHFRRKLAFTRKPVSVLLAVLALAVLKEIYFSDFSHGSVPVTDSLHLCFAFASFSHSVCGFSIILFMLCHFALPFW